MTRGASKLAYLSSALLTLCVAVITVGIGCGTRSKASNAPSPPRVTALGVYEKPIPKFPVARYDTSGTYPQVFRRGMNLRAVNSTLREAVLADQRDYAPEARKEVQMNHHIRGVYKTYPSYPPEPKLVSASTVAVSALIPILRLYPGGNDGEGWITATVLVPSGKTVTINDLFANRTSGIRALSKAWLTEIRLHQRHVWTFCIRRDLSDYGPTAKNYEDFALMSNGLTVGFGQEPACFRSEATVRYSVLRPYLSELGKKLVAGVRQPRFASRLSRPN